MRRPVNEMSDFEKCALQSMIYDFDRSEKQYRTLKRLHTKAQLNLNFDASRQTLRKVIKSMGFR